MSIAQPSGAAGPGAEDEPRLASVLVAFAAIYLFWGSTYLAILWAIESIPPIFMAAVRFLVAGGLLLAWQRLRGAPLGTLRQWKAAAIAGGLLIVGGNGAVVVAEQWVPSGLTALLVSSVPLWMVLLDTLFGSRRAPSGRAIVGLMVGFAGVATLAGSPGVGAGGPQELFGGMIVMGGAMSWAAGSIYSRHVRDLPPAGVWVAMQMLSGGVLLAIVSVALGEPAEVVIASITAKSVLALLYLIFFGAIVGYSAYIWLLRVVAPARIATYAYVNPVVAMILGWALADEPLTGRSMFAAAVILVAVVLITTEAAPNRGVVASGRASRR